MPKEIIGRGTALLVLLLTVLTLTAQPLCRVVKYDEKDGVPSSYITQLLQDTQGFMWFATWNGLCRFDGYEFQTFKPQPGDGCHMTTDRIRNITLLPDETILCRVDDNDYLFDLRSYRFRDLDSTRQRFTESQLMKYRQSRSLQNRQGYSWTDHHHTTWTISSNGTLTYQPKGSETVVDYPLSCSFRTLTFVMADRDGNLWALDNGSIYLFTTDLVRARRLDITPRQEVKCLFADTRGRYWVTTKDDTTIRLYDIATDRLLGYLGNDGAIHQHHTSFGFPVYCMYEMSDGTVWLGTKRGGLFRLREQGSGQFKIDHFIDIPHQDVYCLTADQYGRLWVAMLGGGVCYCEAPESDLPNFKVPKGYPQAQCPRVRYLLMTDSLWLAATGSGLLVAASEHDADAMRFRLHQRETERASSLSSSATMDVVRDAEGYYYVSTESGGVNMIEDRNLLADQLNFRHFNESLHIQPGDNVLSLSVLSDGGLMAIGSHQLTITDRHRHSRVIDSHHFNEYYHFSEAHPLLLKDQRWLIGLTDGAIVTTTDLLKYDKAAPRMVLTGLSVQGGTNLWNIAHTDTLTLQPHERSITLRFAAIDYKAADRLSYAFSLQPAEQWNVSHESPFRAENYIGHDRSATLLDLEPGTYQFIVRSTNAEGEWQQNEHILTIIVTPTFWEAWYGQLLIILLLIATLSAIAYTLLYIRHIKRKHRETLEKYLALIDDKDHKESFDRNVTEEKELDPVIRRIMTFIDENISNSDVGVGDIAAAAAVSRSGLQRKLKQSMGVTPQELLIEARIKRACQLLVSTDKSVSEVAYACGFTDPKYFSRSFKHSTGKTPSEYKNAL